MPFFINNNGDIAYLTNENVILEITGKSIRNSVYDIVKALNQAYKYGYENDHLS